jgi:hypothetical protein
MKLRKVHSNRELYLKMFEETGLDDFDWVEDHNNSECDSLMSDRIPYLVRSLQVRRDEDNIVAVTFYHIQDLLKCKQNWQHSRSDWFVVLKSGQNSSTFREQVDHHPRSRVKCPIEDFSICDSYEGQQIIRINLKRGQRCRFFASLSDVVEAMGHWDWKVSIENPLHSLEDNHIDHRIGLTSPQTVCHIFPTNASP